MPPLIYFGLFVVLLRQAAGTVYIPNVNGANVPPLTAVDAYAPCLRARGDAYCFVSATLVGDADHPVYSLLVEHSADRHKNFNRTNIHRGICLKTCHDFLEISPNVTIALEACLNDTINKQYGLTTNVIRTLCSEYHEKLQLDASDFAFGAVLLVLMMLNLLGSIYDFYGGRGHDTIVGRFLLCFSVKSSWQRLMAPSSGPGRKRLPGLSGYKVVLAMLVILAHSGMIAFHAVDNPEFIEETYRNVFLMLLHRGVEVVQMSFVISAVLLVHKVMKSEERYHWGSLHKALIRRWLRFTPLYALILFFVCTWARHIGEGPFWKATMEVEANDCRRHWWLHLLYIHNYIDNSRCMIPSWSLAVDVQLTALGLAIFCILKGRRARMVAITLVLTAGLITPAAAIYLQNVEPVLITSPEVILNWFSHDPTFNNLYKRAHTNLVSYGLGLALGLVICNLKKTDLEAVKYEKFRLLHWLLIPSVFVFQLTGAVFYYPEIKVPLLARLFYSSAAKLTTAFLMGLHVYLTIVKADGSIFLRTRVLKWRLWAPLGRLTYGVFMLHLIVLRIRSCSLDEVFHVSFYMHMHYFVMATTLSFLIALPLFLFVEAPAAKLTRSFFGPSEHKKHVD